MAAIASSFTLLAYYVFIFVYAGKAHGPPIGIFDPIIFKLFLSLIVFAAIAGFCLGSARMAEAFGYFWGTSSDDLREEGWFKWLMRSLAVILIAGAAILVAHFINGQ